MVSLFVMFPLCMIRGLRNQAAQTKDEKEDETDLWKYWVFG